MRLPIAVSLESRDGEVDQDAKVLNGIVEPKGEGVPPSLRKRPGLSDVGLVKAGTAQLLHEWNGIWTVQADFINGGTLATIVSGSRISNNLSPTNAELQFSARATSSDAATPLLMIKSAKQAWTVNAAGVASAVTFSGSLGSYTYNVTSLTRSGGTATAKTAADTGFSVGQTVTIAGATPVAYNGAVVVTGVTLGSVTPARAVPITVTRAGTTATATSTTAHGLTTATAYTVSGANQTAYNGSYTITVTSPTTFTYTVTVTGLGPASDIPIAITRSGTTATATSSSAHGLSNGNYTLSGSNQSEYNGVKTITVTGTTTFTFTVTVTAAVPATPATGSPIIATWQDRSTFAIDGAGPASNVFTAYCDATHTFQNGDLITFVGTAIAGTWAIYNVGANSYQFNGPLLSYLYSSAFEAPFRVVPTVSSITRSGSTATINTSGTHRVRTGDTITVSGATQAQYNVSSAATAASSTTITYFVTVTDESPATSATGSPIVQASDPSSPATGTIIVTDPALTIDPQFTYTVAGSPATPATGTITATTVADATVPGIAYIDGYFCVMDPNGRVWNSAIDDPTSWGALDSVMAQNIEGGGVAIARSGTYVAALKEWSTECFYNRDDGATGSPLSPVPNNFSRVGCATGDSVADCDGAVVWISQSKGLGRGVHIMQFDQQKKVSTPDIDRILNKDSLATVYAFGMNIEGHSLYVLTLVASNITLVYDITSGVWGQWSSYTLGSNKSITSITRDGTVATVTFAVAHTLNDGDPFKISGANQTEYNGIFQARYVSTTIVTIEVSGSPTTPAAGTLVGVPYTESYFKFTKYASTGNTALLLHESDGHLYQLSAALYQDAGLPINHFARTTRMDGGSTDRKKIPHTRVIGDAVASIAMLRWSDDDCVTFTAYRAVDLSRNEPELRRCGGFKRRTIEFRHVGNTACQTSALELEIGQ